jgi:hypothetical protein
MYSSNQKSILLQEELERRILHGLACEWKNSLWVLDSSHRKLMRKPLFSLRDTRNKLGYWSRERGEICLSQKLVLNHPWDAVREVLLHETAHQFADEVFGADGEPPHGPTFLRACHLLRANPKASGTYRPFDERVSQELSRPEDKIMLRVKKLMALAESHNRHEAELAMAKAHEYIAKYNLDLLAHNEDREFVSVFVGNPALRHFREEYHLAHLLQDFYFVYGLWVSAYVLERGKMGRVLEISGTMHNIKIACYVHDFVRHFINSQWLRYNQDKRLNRYRKADFAVGIIEGFRSKLKSRHAAKTKAADTRLFVPRGGGRERELIKIADPLLLEYAAHRYPHTTSFRRKVSSQDDTILKDGMKVGRKLVVSKGITEKVVSKIFWLGQPPME